MHKLLLFLLSLSITPLTAQIVDSTISSRGTAFWCAFLENLDLSMNDAPSFAFQIEAARDVTGSVTLVGTGLTVPFSVAAGKVATVDLPQAVYYPMGSESVSNLGFLITANDTIQVKALHWRQFFSETAAILPVEALGSHYLAQCYRFQGNDQSSFIVVATEDNTEVTITPTAVTLMGRPSGLPYTVLLNRGQTYQVHALGDLVGTDIRSSTKKPIAVFGGAKTTQVECTSANSHLYDQCLPLDRGRFWEHRFFAVPFYGQTSSVLRVLASEDDTHVLFDCDTVATLQRGMVWTHIYSTAGIVYADKPVAVSQLSRGVQCSGFWQNGDPTLLNLLPEGLYTRKAAVKVPKRTGTGMAFSSNSLLVITRAGQSNQIRLNGASLSNVVHNPLGQRWEYSRVSVKPDSTCRLESDSADFQAYLYGFDFANAYSSWVAYDRMVQDTATDLAALSVPETVCVDSTFTVSVAAGDFQWGEVYFNGVRQNLQPGEPLHFDRPGIVVFRTGVLVDGACQPELISAQTELIACPPPPDTCPIQIPNAFTPNGDQFNDLCRPVRAECGFSEYEFTVYNRWGQVVFSSRQPFEGWDGMLSDGQAASSDVYVCTLVYRRYPGAQQIRLVSEMTLLR